MPSRFSRIKSQLLRFLGFITFVPLFWTGRRRADGRERLELDRPRRTSMLGTGEIRRRVFILRESFYSHRRLQLVVIILALFFILGGTGAAVYFNRSFKAQKEVQKSVRLMTNSSSYHSTGLEIAIEGNREIRVKEVLDYVTPGEVHSTFKTSITVAGQPDTQTNLCRDTLVIVNAQTRYEFCREEGKENEQWKTRTVETDFLLGPQAQPWRRLDWIRKVTEETDVLAEIDGAKTRVYLGTIDKVREANFRFGDVKNNPETDAKILDQWRQFVDHATISIKTWVREEDGLIARFVMFSEYLTVDGIRQTKQIDYSFSKFNAIEPIAAPDTSAPPPSVVGDVTDDGGSAEPGQDGGQPGTPGAGGTQQPGTTPASPGSQGGDGARSPEGSDISQEAVVNGQVFRLEIADTEETRTLALTNRESLPQDSAMLLKFDADEPQTYWMKDMLFPIDIISLDGSRVVVDVTTMEPQPQIPDFALRRHPTVVSARYALVMNAGRADKAGIAVGSVLKLQESSGAGGAQPTPVPDQPTPVPGQPGVQPFLATEAIIFGQSFRIEVADTEEEQTKGLADRDSLAQDSGMLFVFATGAARVFWMKGVNFPLDIIFIDSTRTIVDITTMEPQPFVPDFALRQYQAPPSIYALEINAGLAEKHGIRVGMLVDFR